jgi:hypothetical protein
MEGIVPGDRKEEKRFYQQNAAKFFSCQSHNHATVKYCNIFVAFSSVFALLGNAQRRSLRLEALRDVSFCSERPQLIPLGTGHWLEDERTVRRGR